MVSHERANRPTLKKIIKKIENYVNYRKIERNEGVIKVCVRIPLGRGGYGSVFYGTLTTKNNKDEPKNKISVAVKRIDATQAVGNKREEAALRKLNHPNVIRLFNVAYNDSFRLIPRHQETCLFFLIKQYIIKLLYTSSII